MKSKTIKLQVNKAPNKFKFTKIVHEMNLDRGYNLLANYSDPDFVVIYLGTVNEVSDDQFQQVVNKLNNLLA